MIYTSYFAVQKDNKNAVAICRGVPKWFTGTIYSALAPSWDILMEYKNSEQTEADKARYTKRYKKEILDLLSPQKVYDDLNGKTLLCYEKSGDFCHRHIVSEWLFNYGFEVEEYIKGR